MLLICDGLSHVQSRMGMLDAFAAVFVLAAFATLLVDRDDVRARMALVVAQGRAGDIALRPAAGRALVAAGHRGAARAGLRGQVVGAVLAGRVRGALPCCGTLTARRAAGVATAVEGHDPPRPAAALWAFALVPVLAYLAGWWAWFGSETGDRPLRRRARRGRRVAARADALRALATTPGRCWTSTPA